jgi:GMP synthase-like glutamine amidotransferase
MPLWVLIVNCYHQNKAEKIAPYHTALTLAAGRAGVGIAIREEDDDALSGAPFDLCVISGSHKMVGDGEFEPALADLMRSCERPLLGICYGHQLLAHTFGATVRRDGRKHKGEEEVRRLAPGGLFEGFPETFPMHESHEEVVVRDAALLAAFEETAESSEGGLEAVRHRERPLFGVQFHPEASGEPGLRLFGNFLGMGR